MRSKQHKLLMALLLSSMASLAVADEKEELMMLRNTTLNLIDALVEQGVLDGKKAKLLVQAAEAKAKKATEQAMAESRATQAQAAQRSEAALPDAEKKAVRVTYVPDFVKDQIRQEIRKELKGDVVNDVIAKAKEEKWGLPGSFPEWVSRIKLSGDLRLRGQGNWYGQENQPFSYPDYQAINVAGGVDQAGQDAFMNTTNDQSWMRERVRLGLTAKVSDDIMAGVRITTGNLRDPISTNQTMGNTGGRYQIGLDQAYAKWDLKNDQGFKYLTLQGGRTPNPWVATDNVWDQDLSFEGIAGTARYSLAGGQAGADQLKNSPTLFMTLGYFPIQIDQQQSENKWMGGGQVGLDWLQTNHSRLTVAAAYYDYNNLQGQRNALGSRTNDWTSPQWMQKGNSLFTVSNDFNEDPNKPRLVGLASDYNLASFFASYDYAGFGDKHVILTGEYTKNMGFDQKAMFRRSGVNFSDQTNAYQVRLQVGHSPASDGGGDSLGTGLNSHDWNVSVAYKYLEADAVLDAFTDSDFHLGGTNAKGWVLRGSYGLTKNAWLGVHYFSSDSLQGPPLAVDSLYADVNVNF
ncbi:MAG: hypothetical protein EPN21_09325 [Methylococcaceae bacterium]|nr:MAG: hypothetical protein EPN21_09325 [Methylococcaceae bacterium]